MKNRIFIILVHTALMTLFVAHRVNAQEYVPDSTLSGKIILCNPTTTIFSLGDISSQINKELAIPCITIGNGEELAELSFFPGDVANSICRVKIFKNDIIKPRVLVPWCFYTEGGIRLGMSLNDVISKKGPPDNKTCNCCGKTVRVVYRLDSGSSFLKRYNMPLYSQVFIFDNDYLSTIEYGFEYP